MRNSIIYLVLFGTLMGCMKLPSAEVLDPVEPVALSPGDQPPVTYESSGAVKLVKPSETAENLPPVTYYGLTN